MVRSLGLQHDLSWGGHLTSLRYYPIMVILKVKMVIIIEVIVVIIEVIVVIIEVIMTELSLIQITFFLIDSFSKTFSIIDTFSKASKSPSSAPGSRRSLRTAENRQSSGRTLPEFSANLAPAAPADRSSSQFVGKQDGSSSSQSEDLLTFQRNGLCERT